VTYVGGYRDLLILSAHSRIACVLVTLEIVGRKAAVKLSKGFVSWFISGFEGHHRRIIVENELKGLPQYPYLPEPYVNRVR
jgi:hypothetical protein